MIYLIIWMPCILFLAWAFYDCNIKDYTKKEMPDLRVSEFAPDYVEAVTQSEYRYPDIEREQRKQREQESYARMWDHYYEEIGKAKAQRWKEGNPVTKQNPLTDEEMPSQPYYRRMYYYSP